MGRVGLEVGPQALRERKRDSICKRNVVRALIGHLDLLVNGDVNQGFLRQLKRQAT